MKHMLRYHFYCKEAFSRILTSEAQMVSLCECHWCKRRPVQLHLLWPLLNFCNHSSIVLKCVTAFGVVPVQKPPQMDVFGLGLYGGACTVLSDYRKHTLLLASTIFLTH